MTGAKPVAAADPAKPTNIGAPMLVANMEPAIWKTKEILGLWTITTIPGDVVWKQFLSSGELYVAFPLKI